MRCRGYALPNAIYTDAVGDAGTLLTSADGWVEGGGNKVGGGNALLRAVDSCVRRDILGSSRTPRRCS